MKQIVGATLKDGATTTPKTNYTSSLPPSHYSRLYRRDNLRGGHVIMLGPGNEDAAREALSAWPGGLQIGGGITDENAAFWLDQGASHIIVTSHVFYDGLLDYNRLARLRDLVGRSRMVLDLSCRFRDKEYYVVTDRWQKFTRVAVTRTILAQLSRYCDEFLVHAVDVEGRCMGVDPALISLLAGCAEVPVTYAGGVASLRDLALVREAGLGRLDVTVGSALDIFGGTGLRYDEVVAFCDD